MSYNGDWPGKRRNGVSVQKSKSRCRAVVFHRFPQAVIMADGVAAVADVDERAADADLFFVHRVSEEEWERRRESSWLTTENSAPVLQPNIRTPVSASVAPRMRQRSGG